MALRAGRWLRDRAEWVCLLIALALGAWQRGWATVVLLCALAQSAVVACTLS
jgi:hypothetical protein